MKNALRITMAIVTMLASSASFAAVDQAYVPAQRAAAILADGQPWSALAPDGKTLKFLLKRDGTGSIKGPLPFTLSVTWTVKGDTMCINGKMGEKCLRFKEAPGGLQGWDGEKSDLRFSR